MIFLFSFYIIASNFILFFGTAILNGAGVYNIDIIWKNIFIFQIGDYERYVSCTNWTTITSIIEIFLCSLGLIKMSNISK